MPDIIHLLPDAVANQIAAGEVVQRPASVVKELLENAIDAQATNIKLVVKDAGKTLIQVTDNGIGMSETDARMSFERHATSKIRKTEDIFHIHTKGFRGEALASIAAVAQVELKTRLRGAQTGTLIEIEGSKLKRQEPESCPEGTTFAVKNLFFNIPARRYFLKSDSIELRHIIDEFQRVVLTHPEIAFTFTHNGQEVFSLPAVSLRQRIVHVFGSRYNEKLVPVEESTDIVSVSGFIGKPDTAKKTRGEQFFFINNRFIKNSYLHHAVMTAFQELIPNGHFPLYLLYLTIDPAQIDINIHPTKTEIKFQDERAIYAILHAAVRRALGRFSIAPSLDFEQETSIPITPLRPGQEIKPPSVHINPDFNPFKTDERPKRESVISGWFEKRERSDGWQDLLQIKKEVNTEQYIPEQEEVAQSTVDFELEDDVQPFQLHRKYIVFTTPKGMMLIDQQRAHRRVLFEKYLRQMEEGKGMVQQLLFPAEASLQPADMALIQGQMDDIRALGFDVSIVENNRLEILGVPADASISDAQQLMEDFVEQLKNERDNLQYSPREKMAWAFARSSSIRYGQMLTAPEMSNMVAQLMQCAMPYVAERNKPTLINITLDQLDQQFK
ncbi:MAG TPA: DNA mismatch repair endonuclease MutL [Flavobacteriales bacterium]